MNLPVKILYVINDREWSNHVFEEIMDELPLEFYKKARKFRFWNDRQAFVLGKLLIKKILEENSQLGLNNVQHNEYGKPFVEEELSFNISHSGEYVVCLYSLTRNSIGIDIEKKDSRIKISDFEEVLTKGESQKILDSKDELNAFFEIWTLKEAAMKADGRGLNIPLKEIMIGLEHIEIEKTKWYYQKILVDQDYNCHVVVDAPGVNISLKEVKIEHLISKKYFSL